MAKFGVINTDEVIFAGDRTRIDVSKSFATATEAQSLSLAVRPQADEDFIAAPDGYLDWVYAIPGAYQVAVNVANVDGEETFTKTISVRDLSAAKHFASDSDLVVNEPTIMNFLPPQWSSFNVIHARVKRNIMQWLDSKKVRGAGGAKLTDADLYDAAAFNETAILMALSLIFMGGRVAVGDEFELKAKDYEGRARAAADAAVIRLDTDGDGKAEEIDLLTTRLVRA